MGAWIIKMWFPDSVEAYSVTERKKSGHLDDMKESRGHHVKQNKKNREGK